jgi:hypothetical protein
MQRLLQFQNKWYMHAGEVKPGDLGENEACREVVVVCLLWGEVSGVADVVTSVRSRVCSQETDVALTTAWQILNGAISLQQRL